MAETLYSRNHQSRQISGGDGSMVRSRREELVETALEIFQREGFHAT